MLVITSKQINYTYVLKVVLVEKETQSLVKKLVKKQVKQVPKFQLVILKMPNKVPLKPTFNVLMKVLVPLSIHHHHVLVLVFSLLIPVVKVP